VFYPFFVKLENSGDPPDFSNGSHISYWNCVYFLMVTMSTVGYGDIFCTTILGKISIMLFILVGLVREIINISEFFLSIPWCMTHYCNFRNCYACAFIR